MISLHDLKDTFDNIPILDEESILAFTDSQLEAYFTLLEAKKEFEHNNKILYFKPDDWFMDVAKKMEDNAVCGVIAGNRSGKSYQSTWLFASHLTGIYPRDYDGYKYKRGIDTWCLTSTAEQYAQASGLQEYLFGPINDIGSGWIPKDRIIKTEMGIGVKGFIKKAYITHTDAKGKETTTTIEFKSYSQNIVSLMGASISFALIDEECPYEVLTQVITRTSTPKTGNGTGRVLVSMTPELGLTQVVNSFFEGHYSKGLVRGTVYDVSFLTEEDIEGLKQRYPEHQWEMRLLGKPQLGQGAIYPYEDKSIIIPATDLVIQEHWRVIAGLDLGFNDPTSVSLLALDPDTEKLYLFKEFYEKEAVIPHVASWIKQQAPNIPVVLPHDGFNKTQNAGGIPAYDLFAKEGLNLVYERFSNPPTPDGKKNNHIEPGLSYIREKMRIGEFKVSDDCVNFLKERRTYSYGSNGKPLPIQQDHAMDSTRYATMMIQRFGQEWRSCKSGSQWDNDNSSYPAYNLNVI